MQFLHSELISRKRIARDKFEWIYNAQSHYT